MEVDTDPVPITTVPPTAGHISSFLSCIRRRVADDATATAAPAAGTLATHPSPDVDVDATEGDTAHAASAASAVAVSSVSSDISAPTHDDGATVPTKRRSWNGPARAASREVFYTASSSPGTAGVPADGASAAAATTTDSGVDVDTDATPPAASADAHGSATKKRRRQRSRDMTRIAQRHCQRMATLGADRGNTPRSDPGPIEGRPAEDSAEW